MKTALEEPSISENTPISLRVVLFVVSLAAVAAVDNYRISDSSAQIAELRQARDRADAKAETLNTKLEILQEDAKYTRNELDKVSGKLDALLEGGVHQVKGRPQ